MRYGFFDDKKKEYVIERPDTPKSWSNYLGSLEYGAVITNNAGGFSFYRSSAKGRFMKFLTNKIPVDQPGRYIYIRDNQSADFWSGSWQPVGKDFKKYKSTCRHGTAYTIIESEYNDVFSETLYFVPLNRVFEIWKLKLQNKSNTEKNLSLFSYFEAASHWNMWEDLFDVQFTQTAVKMDFIDGIIRCASMDNLPPDPADFNNELQGRHAFLTVVGAEIANYDTDREAFIGHYRTYSNPLAVEKGQCSGSLAYGDTGCGVLQIDLKLKPGEEKEMAFLLGVGLAETEGKKIRAEFKNIDVINRALVEVKNYWHSRLGSFTVNTPDKEFNSMINVWNAYNCLITYAWSRSASLIYNGERDGLGYRDTVQDLLGVVSIIKEEAKPRLELMITGQCSSGGALHLIKPYAFKPGQETAPKLGEYRSDDCMWLFNTVPAYVKETGDLDFYHKILPYADKDGDTVLKHLKRALEFNIEHSGAHGLPCGLASDWNDNLNLGVNGETTFVAFQLRYALNTYIEICKLFDLSSEISWTEMQIEKLDKNIQTHCWDGEWFIRAITEKGVVIGNKESKEGRIFLSPQSWSVISGAANKEQAIQAMESVNKILHTEYGLMLCYPAFSETPESVYGAVIANRGIKENGGIFCHIQGWAVMAETLLGNNDRAYEYYRNYMPAAYNDRAEIRQIEPYVHCQSTHSTSSRRYGVSRLPWLTGAAAWAYYCATQYILGIRPEYSGLRLDPCLPTAWNEINIQRCFRGKNFNIKIKNNNKRKKADKLTLNGVILEGNLIPMEKCDANNEVVVEL